MRCLTLILSLIAAPLPAHEFWIEPRDFAPAADTTIMANIVNGENFEGQRLPYLPHRFVNFVMIHDGSFARVPGRAGDQPGLRMEPLGEGLHVAAYQATNQTVTYEDWAKFQRFVDHKDLGDIRTLHDARDLPEGGFKEVYSRYSKSLIGVGSGEGTDTRTGLETEIVALTNPYTDDLSQGMRFQLFYQGEPRRDEQLEIFERAPDGAVTQLFFRTDEEGIATVPVKAGHDYMADAVVIREPSAALIEETGAAWETLWANMTWSVPE